LPLGFGQGREYYGQRQKNKIPPVIVLVPEFAVAGGLRGMGQDEVTFRSQGMSVVCKPEKKAGIGIGPLFKKKIIKAVNNKNGQETEPVQRECLF